MRCAGASTCSCAGGWIDSAQPPALDPAAGRIARRRCRLRAFVSLSEAVCGRHAGHQGFPRLPTVCVCRLSGYPIGAYHARRSVDGQTSRSTARQERSPSNARRHRRSTGCGPPCRICSQAAQTSAAASRRARTARGQSRHVARRPAGLFAQTPLNATRAATSSAATSLGSRAAGRSRAEKSPLPSVASARA
jgi:hypothetical protein